MSNNLKTIVRGAYDIQKLRIQMGNRIVGNFKSKLGQTPSKTEETIDAEGKKILKDLRGSFKKITDGIKGLPKQRGFAGDEVIDSYTELVLLAQYLDLERSEANHFKMLGDVLNEYVIYVDFLEQVRGIGPALAGVIVSEIDITKATYPSSLWAYAGLDVASDGKGRSRRKEHLIDSEYINKAGEIATKKGITFNPFLKTKLVGVMGPSFLKSGKDGEYAKVYYEYRNRLENHAVYKEESKGHRHNMAIRKMVKMFLIDLYNVWRPLEGLSVAPTYEEAKLGHKHKVA